MKNWIAGVAGFAASAVLAAMPTNASAKTITLCWAAWDPANALVELSKDFTAKSGRRLPCQGYNS